MSVATILTLLKIVSAVVGWLVANDKLSVPSAEKIGAKLKDIASNIKPYQIPDKDVDPRDTTTNKTSEGNHGNF